MTTQILFIQGGGAGTHDDWDDKLVASLARELGPGYELRYPRMPNEDEPSYPAWKAALAREISALDDGAILIGHSIGGTILVHALAEQAPKRKLAALFLIATPFVGPGGWPSEDIEPAPNLGERLPHTMPVYLFHGSDDDTAPLEHVDLYKQSIAQAHVCKLEGRDHQLNDDLSEVAVDIQRIIS